VIPPYGVFIGGGQIGGNYQIGQFVIATNGTSTGRPTPTTTLVFSFRALGTLWSPTASLITTVAARFGWALDHWLLYGKAGGGWVGSNNFTIANTTTGVSFTCGTLGVTNCSNNNGGRLVGAG
jgi:outer membrane immunogenic protein